MTASVNRDAVILHLTQGKACLIDADQYDQVSQYIWHVTTHGYVARKFGENGKLKQEYLHRRLMGNPDGMIIDHADINPLNNCLKNLRICTRAQNNQNRAAMKGNYKGVHFSKDSKRWVAQIRESGITKHLGSFRTEIEGALAWDKEAKRINGEFAYLNFPDVVPPCICEIALDHEQVLRGVEEKR